MEFNPLLNKYSTLPAFNEIETKHVVPAITSTIETYKRSIESLLDENSVYTWENLIEPITELDHDYHNVISPINHLCSVNHNDEFQEAFDSTIELRTQFGSWLSQHQGLYDAVLQIAANGLVMKQLDDTQRYIITEMVKDYELTGIDLDKADKEEFNKIKQQLSKLQSIFSNNTLKAVNEGWFKHVTNKDDLLGLPDYAIASAEMEAKQRRLDGWVFTLRSPSVSAVLSKAKNRSLREDMYKAYVSIASDQGPDAGKWDNEHIINQIVTLKNKKAQLLGFDSHADLSTHCKMVKNTQTVFDFLYDLLERSRESALYEYEELKEFAEKRGVDNLEKWDLAFYTEVMRETLFGYSDNEVREFFTTDNVLREMLDITTKLYNVSFVEHSTNFTQTEIVRTFDYPVQVWHPDVKFIKVFDSEENHIASFYLDLYARSTKRSGAWMDDCVSRRKLPNGKIQIPVAYLNCNFNPPSEHIPSLLSMDDIETLFHEFGHGLHHMLTDVDYPEVSGVNGVAWDAIELPSQFMEHFCWHADTISNMAKHYKTDAPMHAKLVSMIKQSKNFRSASTMLKQVEFSLFDMMVYTSDDVDVEAIYRKVNKDVAVIPADSYAKFYTSFSHIFCGGYSAGYYSYKWAEVMSSDVFSAFEEHGNIFSHVLGSRFLESILSKGGSKDFMELFVEFRGREPSLEPLLKHNGIQ